MDERINCNRRRTFKKMIVNPNWAPSGTLSSVNGITWEPIFSFCALQWRSSPLVWLSADLVLDNSSCIASKSPICLWWKDFQDVQSDLSFFFQVQRVTKHDKSLKWCTRNTQPYRFIVLSLSLISSHCLSTEVFKTSTCRFNLSASSLCFSASKRQSDSHLNHCLLLSAHLFWRKQEYWERSAQVTNKNVFDTLSWILMGKRLVNVLWAFLWAASRASDFLFSVP